MGGKGCGSEPSDHNCGYVERCGLHTHLQSHRQSEPVEPDEVLPVYTALRKSFPVYPVSVRIEEYCGKDNHHQYSGDKSGDTRSEQSEFRSSELSVDKNPVAYDIEYISSEKNPHWSLCIGNPVRKLFERIEYKDEEQ